MNNDRTTERVSADFIKKLSLIEVVLPKAEAATEPLFPCFETMIPAAAFIGQVATVAFVHALALVDAGAVPPSILLTGEPEAVTVGGVRRGVICNYRIFVPMHSGFVHSKIVDAFEELLRRRESRLIDSSALAVVKQFYGYDEALWIAVNTFAGVLHGQDHFDSMGVVMPPKNGGKVEV